MQKGDVVIIHDDVPRVRWRLAVIEDLICGGDGLVRAAIVRTANKTTNRPITKLYPLELNEGGTVNMSNGDSSIPETEERPSMAPSPVNSATTDPCRVQRAASVRANDLMKEWASVLSGPPEDVAENEL